MKYLNNMELSPYLEHLQDESVCQRCGKCCKYALITPEGAVLSISSLSCKFLERDPESSNYSCSVYEKRHAHNEACEWCLPITEAVKRGYFPNRCPYVKDIEGYQGRFELYDERGVLKVLHEEEKPPGVSEEDWEFTAGGKK